MDCYAPPLLSIRLASANSAARSCANSAARFCACLSAFSASSGAAEIFDDRLRTALEPHPQTNRIQAVDAAVGKRTFLHRFQSDLINFRAEVDEKGAVKLRDF
jgi:hypothetical protein